MSKSKDDQRRRERNELSLLLRMRKGHIPHSDELRALNINPMREYMAHKHRDAARRGDTTAAPAALDSYRGLGRTVPSWLLKKLSEAFQQLIHPRKRRKKRSDAIRGKHGWTMKVGLTINKHLYGSDIDWKRERKRSIDRTLFEDVAAELGFSRRIVEETYYEDYLPRIKERSKRFAVYSRRLGILKARYLSPR